MTSIRNKPSRPAAGRADSRAAILAAARDSILAVGVRRTTLADVARRAGVSRMTVYRAFPDVDSLVGALLTDELADLVTTAQAAAADQPTARARLVESTVAVARALPDDPLYRKVSDVDPELLLPYVLERLGTSQRAAADGFRESVVDGQRDGSIRAGDTRVMAHAVLLTAQSFVLAARADGLPARAKMLAELRVLLDGYLRPTGAQR